LTVALCAALLQLFGHDAELADRAALLRRLLQLHRDFQGGRGSGLDLAASLYGGVIEYTLCAECAPQVRPRTWPAALERVAVWSGRPASTAQMLQALEAWRAEAPDASTAILASLCRLSQQGANAAGAGDAAALLEILNDYSDALQQFGEASKITVFTPEHRRIRDVLQALGAVYKPCGAGGGDLGLAVVAGVAQRAAVLARLRDEQFPVMPLAVDDGGLRLEAGAAPESFESTYCRGSSSV
jgi:phosphomevalonate kinase